MKKQKLEFDLENPIGKKNNMLSVVGRRNFCPSCGSKVRPRVFPNDVAKRFATIARIAVHNACVDFGWEETKNSVQVIIDYNKKMDIATVKVRELPKSPVGMRKDLINLGEIICDEMQGKVYEDDKQIELYELRVLP